MRQRQAWIFEPIQGFAAQHRPTGSRCDDPPARGQVQGVAFVSPQHEIDLKRHRVSQDLENGMGVKAQSADV